MSFVYSSDKLVRAKRLIRRGLHRPVPRLLALSAVLLAALALHPFAAATDLFQEAVDYMLTGQVGGPDAPEIVDREACIVVMPDRRYKRYIRYYLKRFRMDDARISKIYSGRQISYLLEVDGDDVILEYLKPDKTTVEAAYKSAQIPLPGNFDQTERALHLIFSEQCKSNAPQAPF